MRTRTAHTPERSCRVCRNKLPKWELERWVIVENQLRLDKKQTMPGRGVYSCRSSCSVKIDQYIKPRTKSRRVVK